MKTVVDSNGSYRRVKNEMARKLVSTGRFNFAPKWCFKIQQGKVYKGVRHGN